MFSTKTRRRIASMAGTTALAGGIVLGTAASASARTINVDCIPGPCSGIYSSKGDGGRAGVGSTPYGTSQIRWDESGNADVQVNISDVLPDGNGPLLLVRGDDGTGLPNNITYNNIHLRTGYKTSDNRTVHFNDVVAISLRMCNGTDANGNPQNCEANWHGPFHAN